RADPCAQHVRGLESGDLRADCLPKRQALVAEPRARRAASHMRLELRRFRSSELSVEIRVDLQFHFRVSHCAAPRWPISVSWRRFRARDSLDMIVPTGTPTTSLISL